MAFKVIKSSESTVNPTLKMLVAGSPGSGKTRLASTFPNVVYLDAEAGLLSVKDREWRRVPITSMSEFEDAIKALAQRPSTRTEMFDGPVQTVVVDTLDEIARIIQRERLTSERRDTFNMQDWGYLGEELRRCTRALRNIEDLNVIFTTHLKSTEDSETGRVVYQPAIGGAFSQEVAAFVDIAGLLVARSVRDQKTGQKQMTRVLQVFPDPQYPWLKDRLGSLGAEFPITLDDDYDRMVDVIWPDLGFQREQAIEEIVRITASLEDEKREEAKAAAEPEVAPEPEAEAPKPAKKAASKKASAKKASAPKEATPAPAEEEAPVEAPAEAPAPEPEPIVATPDVEEQIEAAPVEEATPEPEPEAPAEVAAEPEATPEPEVEAEPEGEADDDAPHGVCSECGKPIESQDYAELSMLKYKEALCRTDFAARKKR